MATPAGAIDDAALLQAAEAALRQAYAKYSDFRVGAALLTSSGRVFHETTATVTSGSPCTSGDPISHNSVRCCCMTVPLRKRRSRERTDVRQTAYGWPRFKN